MDLEVREMTGEEKSKYLKRVKTYGRELHTLEQELVRIYLDIFV